MGKLYMDLETDPPRRVARRELHLVWRAEPPNYSTPPRNLIAISSSLEAARELNELMEKGAMTRTAALRDPETDPQTRKKLLEEEDRIAQAYRYLAMQIR